MCYLSGDSNGRPWRVEDVTNTSKVFSLDELAALAGTLTDAPEYPPVTPEVEFVYYKGVPMLVWKKLDKPPG